jgi:hypothetical protein
LPAAARRGVLGAAWPSPQDAESLAAVEAAWAAAEAALVAAAGPAAGAYTRSLFSST